MSPSFAPLPPQMNALEMSEVTSSLLNVTTTLDVIPRWQYSSYVTVVTTVVTLSVSVVGLALNVVLVMTIKCSPSLKTPPNSHLLNICFNNLLLGLQAFLSLPAIHLIGAHEPQRGSEVLSGIQLFVVMHCLLQYWGAFGSIGYYRFKTLHRPSLSLRMRKVIVSRSITATWMISLLLALTFSLTSAKDSAYLPLTLDPFRNSFYVRVLEQDEGRGEDEDVGTDMGQNAEQMVVLSVVMAALLLGLFFILLSYYSICRTLNLAGRAGKSRVSPWPRRSTTSLTPPCSEVMGPASSVTEITTENGLASGGRAYRADGDSELFCVSGPQSDRGDAVWMVHYHKYDHSVCIRDLISHDMTPQSGQQQTKPASVKRDIYANMRPLTANLSTGSTTSSGKVSSTKCPDFSDISLGADFARRQKQLNRSALKKQSVRRERGSLSNASKNSLVMLTAYLLFSLPLIVCQIPGSLSHLCPEHRVQVLLVCRLLFLLNCPVYPLWYLLFSVRVKKCLKRMCETLPVRFPYQQR